MSPRSRNLFLGWSSQEPLTRLLLSDPSQKSQLIIAQAGSGKSRSYAIPNLIRYDGSMFVTDYNDELTKATALWRSGVLGQQVLIGDPMRTVDPRYLPKGEDGEPTYLRINPIDYIRAARNPSLAAYSIAEILIPANAMREPHWSEGAQGRLVATMLFVAFDESLDELGLARNMGTVWLLLSRPELERESLILMSESDNPFIADQAAAVLNAGDDNREQAGIRNHLRVACGKLFAEPAILDFMSSTSINFADLRTKKITVYLCVPGNMVSTLSKLFGVIMKIALDQIEALGRLPYDPYGPPMVVFQADEFQVMGRFKPFVDGIARYRGFGIKFQLYCQTLGQLADPDLYGHGYKTILGNVGTIVYFGGTGDYFTAEIISQLCGVKTDPGVTKTDNGQANSQKSVTTGLHGRPSYLPDEIMRYELPKQLILRASHQPCEAYLFEPDLTSFPDHFGFMLSLEEGHSLKYCVRMAEMMLEPTPAPANDNPPPPANDNRKGFLGWLFGKE